MSNISSTANPTLTSGNNKRVRELVKNITDLVPQVRELENKEYSLKQKLRERLKPLYWDYNVYYATGDSEHTFDVLGQHNSLVQVNFVNKYQLTEEKFKQLKKCFKHPEEWLVESYDIKINPQHLEGQDKVDFLRELKDVCEAYGVDPSVQESYGFIPEFHEERWQLGTEVNQKIDAIAPVEVQVNPVF